MSANRDWAYDYRLSLSTLGIIVAKKSQTKSKLNSFQGLQVSDL